METDDQGDIVEVKDVFFSPPTFPQPTVAFPAHRALFICIKTTQGREEQRVGTMAAPFHGFSTFVRFQCRAKIHQVQNVILPPL